VAPCLAFFLAACFPSGVFVIVTKVPSTGPVRPSGMSVYRQLTPRDRLLLSWLAEHYLLSTDQVARALFDSLRTAQQRLTILHRRHVLDRFVDARADGAMATRYLYTLGPDGLRLHPDAWHDPDRLGLKPPRTSLERADRIARSPALRHLLGVNQFFVDLHHHTRHHAQSRLLRWWSEQHATAVYNKQLGSGRTVRRGGVYPDGHGIWAAHTRQVAFFVEHDRGTEPLSRVVAKLKGYERLARTGPRYAVLLWVPHPIREAGLLDLMDGADFPMPVATAVHTDDPAAPIWALSTDPGHRVALHELPADPGEDGDSDEYGDPDQPDRYGDFEEPDADEDSAGPNDWADDPADQRAEQ
jgi:Replication-relaxation